MSIRTFYKDREIFITGGTGFMGKVLIEKLLRSCPDIKKIYVLVRSKKGKSIEERLKDITETPLFDILKKDNPNILDKLEAINGDVTLLNLGVSDEDFEKIQNVSIVFHSAASVRFDDPLRNAVLLNTRGTLEVLKVAEKLKKLDVFLHVSTTYCYPDRHVVEERLYPANADWRTVIKVAEKFDDQTMNILKAKYSRYQPNTYTFTKSLAEQIVNEYKDKLPVAIYRPSIVISTLSDPFPGWIDNFNGPVAMLLACGVGIYRTMYGDPDVVQDYTPVDVAIKGLIAAAYERAAENPSGDELMIYNCSTATTIRPLSVGEMINTAKELVWEYPFERALWIPGGSITRCRVYNYIRFMLFHVLAAIAVDTVLKFLNQKPFLVKLQRRIYAANLALYYFATTHWTFPNNNFLALGEKITESGQHDFDFLREKNVCIRSYILNAIQGCRKYLLKEAEGGMERARKNQQKMMILDFILKGVFSVLFIYFSISVIMKYVVNSF